MTDILLEWVSHYGLAILAGSIYLAALGAPLPASVLLVLSGAFAASGEMDFWSVALTAYFSAVAGDISGYAIAYRGGTWLRPRLRRSALGTQLGRTEAFMEKWGGLGVFFSRWLVAPLGPTVNYVSGLSRLGWRRFILWDLLGEVVWVSAYITIGTAFSTSALMLVDMIASASWVFIGVLGMYFMGRRLQKLARRAGKAKA